MCRLGPGGDTRAYIWRQSWRKLETLTAPIRPESAFDPKWKIACKARICSALPGQITDIKPLSDKELTQPNGD